MNSIIHGLEGVTLGEINITITEDNDLVKIKFKDNGKGVESSQLSKLFDPFFYN